MLRAFPCRGGDSRRDTPAEGCARPGLSGSTRRGVGFPASPGRLAPDRSDFWCTERRRGVVMPQGPTGTVTFLFSDLEGSTRLWEQHPEAMRPALARHDGILRDAVAEQGGTTV